MHASFEPRIFVSSSDCPNKYSCHHAGMEMARVDDKWYVAWTSDINRNWDDQRAEEKEAIFLLADNMELAYERVAQGRAACQLCCKTGQPLS